MQNRKIIKKQSDILTTDFIFEDNVHDKYYMFRYSTVKKKLLDSPITMKILILEDNSVRESFHKVVLKIYNAQKINHKTEIDKIFMGVFSFIFEGKLISKSIELKIVAKNKYKNGNILVESPDWIKYKKLYESH